MHADVPKVDVQHARFDPVEFLQNPPRFRAIDGDRSPPDLLLPKPPQRVRAGFGQPHDLWKGKAPGLLPLLAKDDCSKGSQRRDLPINVQHLGLQKRHDVLHRHRWIWGNVACRKHRAIYLPAPMRREVEIQNQLGLHARPAAEFVRTVQRFDCDVTIHKGEDRFSAGSIIEVLTANLDCGCRVTLEALGPDAQPALDRLEVLLRDFKEQEERGE